MSHNNFTVLTILGLFLAAPAFSSVGDHFGAAFTKARLVPLAELLAKTEQYKGKTVKVKGTIKDVCQREGCWLVLTDGMREIRVSMKDHTFTVPKDSANKTVIVEGVVEKKTVSEEMARHYAEESSMKTDMNSLKGPQVAVTLTATGVRING